LRPGIYLGQVSAAGDDLLELPQDGDSRTGVPGNNVGAIRVNQFPRRANGFELATGDHATSQPYPDAASVSVVSGGSGWTAARIGVGGSG